MTSHTHRSVFSQVLDSMKLIIDNLSVSVALLGGAERTGKGTSVDTEQVSEEGTDRKTDWYGDRGR